MEDQPGGHPGRHQDEVPDYRQTGKYTEIDWVFVASIHDCSENVYALIVFFQKLKLFTFPPNLVDANMEWISIFQEKRKIPNNQCGEKSNKPVGKDKTEWNPDVIILYIHLWPLDVF